MGGAAGGCGRDGWFEPRAAARGAECGGGCGEGVAQVGGRSAAFEGSDGGAGGEEGSAGVAGAGRGTGAGADRADEIPRRRDGDGAVVPGVGRRVVCVGAGFAVNTRSGSPRRRRDRRGGAEKTQLLSPTSRRYFFI